MTQSCIEKGYEHFLLITADTSRLSTRIERASGFVDALTDANMRHARLTIEDKHTNLEQIKEFLQKKSIPMKKLWYLFLTVGPYLQSLPLSKS